MTSPSLRKLRITRWSTLRETCESRAIRACGVALTALCLFSSGAAAADPISELKQRSADERWRELSGGWTVGSGTTTQSLSPVNQTATPVRAGSIAQPAGLPVPQQHGPTLSGSLDGGAIPPAPLDSTLSATAVDIPAGDVSLSADLTSGRPQGIAPQLAPADLTFSDQAGGYATPVLMQAPSGEAPAFPMSQPQGQPMPQGGVQPQAVPFDSAIPGRTPVQTQPSNLPSTTYSPIPLGEVLPYHDYSPQGIEICPSPNARCPVDQKLPEGQLADRSFPPLEFYWQASNIFSPPLYFEDPSLERSGHTHHPLVQPFASVGRFGVQFAGLPYFMAIKPPHVCESPLGHFRPGECAPKQYEPFPLNAEAAVIAAGFYTAMGFIYPF